MKTERKYKSYLVTVDSQAVPNTSIAAEMVGVSKQLLQYHIVRSDYNLDMVFNNKRIIIKTFN